MPLLDITNPRVINFLLENYEKESRLRMRWVNFHKEKINACATFKREVKNYTPADITEASIVAVIGATTRDHIVAARHRLRAPPPDYLLANLNTVRKPEPPMMAVEKETKEILLESRKDYLKIRSTLGPEDKYFFMEAGNWKYGWKLNESQLKMRGPAHGRVCHMLHTMQSRVGPQRDPDHYGPPDTNVTYCTRL